MVVHQKRAISSWAEIEKQPYFLPTTTVVTVQEFGNAFFSCKVENLYNQTVSHFKGVKNYFTLPPSVRSCLVCTQAFYTLKASMRMRSLLICISLMCPQLLYTHALCALTLAVHSRVLCAPLCVNVCFVLISFARSRHFYIHIHMAIQFPGIQTLLLFVRSHFFALQFSYT